MKEITNNLLKVALNTIEVEANAILQLRDSINDNFLACVELIAQSKGRLVITGIGKSAIIGQKIVATLNSTGTPAIFMHAADAIHGDLGMIRSEDIVLCISKSGNTPEIKVLIPFIKNLGNTLIGMVSNPSSQLGKHADYILHTPVDKEADPNNLAPTTSTTVQMVMGDALATTLLALKGFTPRDFAQYHPGGALGKQLYLRVSDIYPKDIVPKVYLDTPLRQVIIEMTSKRLGCTVVLNQDEVLQGIITDGDLRRMLNQNQDVTQVLAKDIMTANPKTIEPTILALKALNIMRNLSITQLIITHKTQYLGIIHLHDLLREGLV